MDLLNETLEHVRLSISGGVAASGVAARTDHKPVDTETSQLPTVSAPGPPAPASTQTPISQEAANPPTGSARARGARDPQAVSECIGIWADFKTTWYTHPDSPEYCICSSCYEDYIRGTQFYDHFRGSICDDGKPRMCGFSKPRMRDDLFRSAVATGSLDAVVRYMVLRSSIPECKGSGGVNGSAGIQWYRPKDLAIPAMVICRACYEDQVLVHREFATNFELSAFPHPADETWSCDMSVPYISREYSVRAKSRDWASFVREVSARLSLSPCPKEQTIYPDGGGKRWFTPVDGPQGFLVCAACFCDYVLHTGQEPKWRAVAGELVPVFGVSVRCCLGQPNTAALAGRTLETGDYGLFWRAVDAVCREPACERKGIPAREAKWYTLRSNPSGFGVCGACYATSVATYGAADLFVPKTDVAPDATVICSLNPAMPRSGSYTSRFLLMMLTRDPGPLERFANEYAYIPLCRGAKQLANARWFGWSQCKICPECYHQFARGTVLAGAMALQGAPVEGYAMCELYSARMRGLYLAGCAAEPPDPRPLLEASAQRRAVWFETMPRVEQFIRDQNLALGRQQMLQSQSSFYLHVGRQHEAVMQSGLRYDVPGLGSGFSNQLEITGAEYGRQAARVGSQIAGGGWEGIKMLEKRWNAVE